MSLMWSTSLTLIARLVLFGLSLGTNIILARSLGPAGRGVYAVAVLLPSILTLVANLGIGPANVYHVSRSSLDKRQVVAASLAAALALGSLAYVLILLGVRITGGHSVLGVPAGYLLITGLSLPFALAAAFMQGVLHGERRFVQLNAVLLFQSVSLAGLLIVLLFVQVDRLLASITAWTVSAVMSGLFAVVLVGQRHTFSPGIHFPTLKAVLRYGFLTYLGTLTSFVNYRFDLLLVNVFAGTAQAGLYAVATGLAEVIWFLPNSVYIALAPTVAAATEEESAKLSARATRSVLALTAAMALVLAGAAPIAIPALFGAEFTTSTVAVWTLLPGIVTFSVWKIMSCYLLGRNLLKQDLLAVTIAMVVTLLLDLALIPRYGFRGASAASSIAYTTAMLVDLFWVVRRSGLPPTRWLLAVPADSEPILSQLGRVRRGAGARAPE